MSVDLKRGETLPIHVNMTFPSLPCDGKLPIHWSHTSYLHTFWNSNGCKLWSFWSYSIEHGCYRHVREAWSWSWYKHLEGKMNQDANAKITKSFFSLVYWFIIDFNCSLTTSICSSVSTVMVISLAQNIYLILLKRSMITHLTSMVTS